MKLHVLTLFISLVIPLSSPAAEWWEALGDTLLDSLETEALAANYDLDAAMRRVNIAQSNLAAARAAYYPTVGISAGWGKEGRNEPSAWSLGANMSWEIDLFGRVAATSKERKAQIRASRADLEGSRLSVAASVAQAYIDLRSYQAQRTLAQRQAEDQKKVADMVQARYDAGLSDRMEVAQSLTVYYSTTASIPPLQTSIQQSVTALAVLLAVQPSELAPRLLAVDSLPEPSAVILPEEIPADDIRERPDLIAAAAQIDAAAAAVGIAKKEYLPSLSLTGTISTSHHSLNKLFTDESFDYSIAPTLSWTVFDGLARRAGVNSARENLEIAVDQYNQALLNGYCEVRNALDGYANTLQTIDLLQQTVKQSEIALDKSISLYKLDLTNYTSVMQNQISLLTYRTQLIRNRAGILDAFVNFHKAVGR